MEKVYKGGADQTCQMLMTGQVTWGLMVDY